MMRAQTIVPGFRNGQRFRYIVRWPDTAAEVGMYITVKQMSDSFATNQVRAAVWTTMEYLAQIRRQAQRSGDSMPTGVVQRFHDIDVQVDLV